MCVIKLIKSCNASGLYAVTQITQHSVHHDNQWKPALQSCDLWLNNVSAIVLTLISKLLKWSIKFNTVHPTTRQMLLTFYDHEPLLSKQNLKKNKLRRTSQNDLVRATGVEQCNLVWVNIISLDPWTKWCAVKQCWYWTSACTIFEVAWAHGLLHIVHWAESQTHRQCISQHCSAKFWNDANIKCISHLVQFRWNRLNLKRRK